jgi:hypothetical protein
MTIRAELSSDTIAVSCGITVHTGSPVLALCRRLLDEGCASSMPMEAYRGTTLALRIRSIGEAAGLEVTSEGVRFRPARQPHPARPISATMPSSVASREKEPRSSYRFWAQKNRAG